MEWQLGLQQSFSHFSMTFSVATLFKTNLMPRLWVVSARKRAVKTFGAGTTYAAGGATGSCHLAPGGVHLNGLTEAATACQSQQVESHSC